MTEDLSGAGFLRTPPEDPHISADKAKADLVLPKRGFASAIRDMWNAQSKHIFSDVCLVDLYRLIDRAIEENEDHRAALLASGIGVAEEVAENTRHLSHLVVRLRALLGAGVAGVGLFRWWLLRRPAGTQRWE